jgi:hypothetical protein
MTQKLYLSVLCLFVINSVYDSRARASLIRPPKSVPECEVIMQYSCAQTRLFQRQMNNTKGLSRRPSRDTEIEAIFRLCMRNKSSISTHNKTGDETKGSDGKKRRAEVRRAMSLLELQSTRRCVSAAMAFWRTEKSEKAGGVRSKKAIVSSPE